MESSTHTFAPAALQEPPASIRWRNWPLVDWRPWSWLAVPALFGMGAVVWYFGGGWVLALVCMIGFGLTFWQFWVPLTYDIDPLGLRRHAFGRSRLIPWIAVRAYRVRPTGIILYRRPEPTAYDDLRSVFVPFSAEQDDVLLAIREHLPHATELES